MIADRLPELANFSDEEKWQLMAELEEQLLKGDSTQQEPLKSEIVQYLNEQVAHYLANPESGFTPAQVSERMRAQKSR